MAVAKLWSTIIEKQLTKGHVLSSSNIARLVKSAQGKLVLAIHKGKLRHISKYGSMSLVRTFCAIVPQILKRRPPHFDSTLQGTMAAGQKKPKHNGDSESATKSILQLFGADTLEGFKKLHRRIKRKLKNPADC